MTVLKFQKGKDVIFRKGFPRMKFEQAFEL